MRKTIKQSDRSLSIIQVINTVNTIFSILLMIYILTSSEDYLKIISILQVMGFSTLSSIGQMIISCLICGSLHQKSKTFHQILEDFNSNELTDNDYKEWLMFMSIASKGGFGFTIGGFALLNKTTLISV